MVMSGAEICPFHIQELWKALTVMKGVYRWEKAYPPRVDNSSGQW
jgi:hypothetical protein